VPGSEQPEGLAARSSDLIIPTHPRCVNGSPKSFGGLFYLINRKSHSVMKTTKVAVNQKETYMMVSNKTTWSGSITIWPCWSRKKLLIIERR